jgi:HAD superfamily hydrolase (TIGR01509 family)
MIQALIFDFDGLILETEEPIYQSWQEIYREYGCELSFEYWSSIIGTSDFASSPITNLEKQVGIPILRDEITKKQHEREMELVLQKPVLPGVEEYLTRAHELKMGIGLASSSTCEWVTGHLKRLDLLHYFDSIKGSDDVEKTKPDPALYNAVINELGVKAGEAIVFEDSPKGIQAAKSAGLFCVVVPNALTRKLPLDNADMILESLNDLSLDVLLNKFNRQVGSISQLS